VNIHSNKTNTQKIWALLKPDECRFLVLLFILMLFCTVLELLGIGLIIPTITILTEANIAERFPVLVPLLDLLGNPDRGTLVKIAMLGLVGIYAIKNIFLALLVWLQTKFTFNTEVRISQNLFEHYLRQPYTFHLQRNSAELFRNITGEVHLFVSYGIGPSMILISESLILLAIASLVLTVEPIGAIVVICFLGLMVFLFQKIMRNRVSGWGKKRQYHEGLRIQHLQQGFGGVKDLKLLGRESEFLEQYEFHNKESSKAARLQTAVQQLPRLLLEFLVILSLALLVVIMLFQGNNLEVILPTLGLFAVAAFRLMPSVVRITNSMQSLRYAIPVIDNLYKEIMLLHPEVVLKNGNNIKFSNRLEIEGVDFAYSGSEQTVVKNVSLAIGYGESVGIIGSSGSGKSTLVDILLGLLSPDEGKVLVDDKDIQSSMRAWQNQIGYVPQSIYLTDDTLRRNVAFGISNEKIDEDAVWHAIRAAQLDEFVKTLPLGLDTIVGEDGVRLSGGQRQRIGIARALYHDPAVLILDEATSALDTQTEHSVMEAVRALKGEKTIIIIAHRLSTVESCDHLYVLEDGRLIQEGVPEKILTSG